MRSRKTLLTRLVALTLATVAASAVQAQPQPRDDGSGPWYLRAAQSFNYDSNIFRVPDGEDNHESDTISITELTAGIDQPYGRQRYLGELSLFINRFNDNDHLNNTGHQLLLGMDWSAAQRWSGDIRLRSRERLASFEEFGAVEDEDDKVKEKSNSFDFNAQYGAASLWVLEGGFGLRDVKFDESLSADESPQFEGQEYDQTRVFAGVGYRPSDLIRFGVRLRHAQGEFGADDDYDRNDLEFNTLWRPSGLSTIDARVAWTKEDHDVETRDFDGVTGAIGWTYVPTGKLQFDTRFVRDTSNRAGTAEFLGGERSFLTNARLTNRLVFGARWLATAKITVDGRLEYARDKYDANFVDQDDDDIDGSGKTRLARLRASYAPTRNWLLSCTVGYQSRSTPFPDNQSGLPRDFDTKFGGCSAQFELR
jgi:hypothetical protein